MKKYLQKHWLELVVHLCCVLPLLGLWQAWRTVNPNQALIQTAGRYGIRLLVLSLLVTPLQQLLPRRVSIVPIRKLLGLYGFAYILTHFVVLIGLEYGFLNGSDWGLAWQFLWEDLGTKWYIWIGLTAFTLLTPLAITSLQWWQRKLKKHWKTLHKLVYLIVPLGVWHFWVAIKAGSSFEPVLLAVGVAVLLALRLAPVKRVVQPAAARFWQARQRRT